MACFQEPSRWLVPRTVRKGNCMTEPTRRPAKSEFVDTLHTMFDEAMHNGKPFLDIRSADLHARVGGYPGRGHAMPSCCTAMREAISAGDEVLVEPPRGAGPSLLIRYKLPRI
jgi:hypothetical protein